MRDAVGSFEWKLKYNPRQPCLGSGNLHKLLASSEEAATEGGKSWTGFSSKIVARHFPSAPIDRLNSSKMDHFTWTVIGQTRTRNSSFWQSHWSQPSALEKDHQSRSHRLDDCRHCVVCVCKTREVWDLRGRISRKWWREFARIVDYLTSTWSGVWKPPPPHLPHIRPSKNLQQFHKCNSHLPIQTHLQKHTFTQKHKYT